MKEFNSERFCSNLISLRGEDTRDVFVKKLGIGAHILSLLENGEKIPSVDLLKKVCDLTETSIEDYFTNPASDNLIHLASSLGKVDKLKIQEMHERIKIREKYETLAKRGRYTIN